ncbi:MAG: hypothetical protein RBR67_01090 [Desulfobacterium sp.]|jgi:hypothetical protein|nr:hypothetical protein [Desulfobacterium sp.]
MGFKSWSEQLEKHKVLLVIVIVAFFVLELQVFILATMRSGHQSYMQVLDKNEEVVYEVKGATMTNFNRYYFENTFGPFENYRVKLVTKDVPFPFRAWFTAAVGIPIGLILLLGFILKAVMVFLGGDDPSGKRFPGPENQSDDQLNDKPGNKQEGSNKVEALFFRVSRFNIFIIGFLVLAAVLLYWIIPNLISFVARTGIETIVDYKWFFIAVVAGLFVLFAWFMYMKYRLAHKSMEIQTEIRKYELELEYKKSAGAPMSLDYDDTQRPKMLGYGEQKDQPENSANDER